MREPKPSVFAVIQNNKGEILMVKKKYGKFDWTCPGGFMDPGKTPEEAIKREVLEESNCSIKNIKFRHVYSVPFRSDIILTFTADIDKIYNFKEDDEISEVNFFNRESLPSSVTNESIRKIDDALMQMGSNLFYFDEFMI